MVRSHSHAIMMSWLTSTQQHGSTRVPMIGQRNDLPTSGRAQQLLAPTTQSTPSHAQGQHNVCRRGVDGNWRPLRLGAKGYSAAGWTTFAVGNGMRFIAMRFGAQTVLAGLTSAQFVVVPMASYWLLGEAVTLSSVLGVVIILLGAADSLIAAAKQPNCQHARKPAPRCHQTPSAQPPCS